MTTGKLNIFERGAYKARLLTYALPLFRESEKTLGSAFGRATKKGAKFPDKTFREFSKSFFQAVIYGELALFWGAFDAYSVAIFGNSRTLFKSIRDRCPTFRAPCHRDHKEVHVLTILKVVRDRELHGLPDYNNYPPDNFSCDRSPDGIILQEVQVREYDDQRKVIMLEGMDDVELDALVKALPSSRYDKTPPLGTMLGEVLAEEAVACVRAFDEISDLSGELDQAREVPKRKPVTFFVSP